MKQECKDCNESLDDCTCIEDTIDLPNQALIDAAEKYADEYKGEEQDPWFDFIEGAKWQQERSYSLEDLECAWNSSDQNMRFQFSSSAYKAITFKQWLEKYENER
jgi:hypothetical protein